VTLLFALAPWRLAGGVGDEGLSGWASALTLTQSQEERRGPLLVGHSALRGVIRVGSLCLEGC